MSPYEELSQPELTRFCRDYLLYNFSGPRLFSCLPYLAEDLLQNQVRIYLQHGGNLLTDDLFRLQNLLLFRGQGAANWVTGCLFQSPGSCTVDDLSSLEICFLGALAHADSAFRCRLKAYLTSYRSPLLAAGAIYADSLLESTFGIASVLSHFYRLDMEESRDLLLTICRIGTPSMLRPFINIGIDLNDDDCATNMLGHAAQVGNLKIVRMLIERGANSALALFHFISESRDLSDRLFKLLLRLLIRSARPTSFGFARCDALLTVIKSDRALLTHPEAPKILMRRRVFSNKLIKRSCQRAGECNYMCVAIRKGLGSVVKLLLQNGAYANTMSTWLMFSIECGNASCTETLIQHGADVNFLDGAGRSAFQVARSNVTTRHPRSITHPLAHWGEIDLMDYFPRVTAEDDVNTFAVVERALEIKAQSTKNLEVCGPGCELESQSLNQEGEAMPVAQNIFKKAFGSLLAYYQHPLHEWQSRYRYYEMRNLWSLSFYEALLMRFFFVLSYVLLLAVGILAVVRGDQRVRLPSRSILSALALLLLAYIWGSSLQTNLSTKLDNSRSVTKQDS